MLNITSEIEKEKLIHKMAALRELGDCVGASGDKLVNQLCVD